MKTPADAAKSMMDQSVETPVYADQRDVESTLLAKLVAGINSDQADLILDMEAVDFHFRDHQGIFATLKALAKAGGHVDEAVSRELSDAWPETMEGIFDAVFLFDRQDGGEVRPVFDYKRRVIDRANISRARQIGNNFTAALDAAGDAADAAVDLPALLDELQKAVFDLARTDRIAQPILSQADLTDRFLVDLANQTPGMKTGFKYLDKIIRGLPPGLFVIAAPPSAGKTTYVLQLVDQVAELNEAPILYFTYEQSPYDLWIKSLARLTKIAGHPIKNEDIKEGKSPTRVEEAAEKYKGFAKWVKVIEGDRQHTVERIRLLAQREKIKTGKAPVLVIDYLQILPVNDAKQDKRISVDLLVSDLRRIARDIGSPVIAISAMSRAEYDKVKMSGFKESGGIEYGTDLAAILSVEEEDGGVKRTVSLSIIKNRNGRRGKVGMQYDMAHDHFEETDHSDISYTETLGKDTEPQR